MKKLHLPLKIVILLLFFSLSLPGFTQIYDDFNSYNTGVFHKANGWTNGWPFNCTWREECVTFSGGIMSLTINNDSGGSVPYKAGEYRTNNSVSYGLFEVSMKASKALGTTSTFFTYTGPYDGNPWDEIDIEVIWRNSDGSLSQNGILQTNYFTNGSGGHETLINLSFDASAAFHTYAFEWSPDYIKWYVDGSLVHTENGSRGALPTTPGKIMMNHWPGTGVDGWLGRFNGQVPKSAQYNWIRYTPAGSVTPAPTTEPTNSPTSAPKNIGDVNNDKNINIIDALLIAQYYVGLNPQNFDKSKADANCDNSITIIDALKVAQYYVGIITKFC